MSFMWSKKKLRRKSRLNY